VVPAVAVTVGGPPTGLLPTGLLPTGLTLGVEEEFHVVDPATRRLVPRAPEVLAAFPASPRVKPELQDSVVEGNSAVATDLAGLTADLTALRTEIVTAAEAAGLAVVAAGTVPLADPAEITVSADERYERMSEDYQQLSREQLICGVQTHVGLPDPELALVVAHRVTPWLPLLLAVSASSPFWLGGDTGFASWRSQVWRRWPTTGPLPAVTTLGELDRLSGELVATGVVSDPGMLYWDIRFNRRVGTLEFRVGDACPSVEVVVALAALARGLVATAHAELSAGAATPSVPVPVLEAARWRASRSGVAGLLVHPRTGRPQPAVDVLAALVEHVRPALDAEGDTARVLATLAGVLATGGSAGEQRGTAREAGLNGVVDALVAETAGRAGGP